MMNNQLIEKIITSNNLPCPEFTYENPVLGRSVAKALSKSFVKILNLSQQNSKVNNNLRLSILENIRKICQTEPDNHIKVDENITTLLLEFYEQTIKDSTISDSDSTDKNLDAFLIRNLKDLNLNSIYISPWNPEVVQALINLNIVYLGTLLKDIIHWNNTEKKNMQILKDIWTSDCVNSIPHEDISIILKPEIEKLLLEVCYSILSETDLDIKSIFISEKSLRYLATKCSVSASCFQICCGILNYLFIMTNFDKRLQTFVQIFVKHVKESCSYVTFSVLYPLHLSHMIVLLDTDIETFPKLIQNNYIISTKKYLSDLRKKSENELIMLISHFPQWFDVY